MQRLNATLASDEVLRRIGIIYREDDSLTPEQRTEIEDIMAKPNLTQPEALALLRRLARSWMNPNINTPQYPL